MKDFFSSLLEQKSPGVRYITAIPIQKLPVFLKKFLPSSLFIRLIAWHYNVD